MRQELLRNNPTYYKTNAQALNRDAEAYARMRMAYNDPLSPTKGNALTSAMRSIGNEDIVGGVTGSRIKEDLARRQKATNTRAKLNSLKGNDLNDELKRMEAMTRL